MSSFENWLKDSIGLEIPSLGIEKMRHFFNKYLHSHFPKIITVAGTNGKGESCHYLSHYFEEAGLKVGRWTSPHVYSILERFHFTDAAVNENELLETAKELLILMDNEGLKLSYYEFLFSCFCLLSKQREIDVLILEVGLGGRLDSVNLFDADIIALTSISLDHTEILGDNEIDILQEKLGVCRVNKPLYSSIYQLELLDYLTAFTSQQSISWTNLYDELLDYSRLNHLLVSAILQNEFDIKVSDYIHIKSPGRGNKVVIKGHEFELYGSHNQAGINCLLRRIGDQKDFSYDRIILSFSDRPDDEVISILKELISFCPRGVDLSVYSFSHFKAKKNLQQLLQNHNLDSFYKGEFSSQVFETNTPKNLVLGSYYFIENFRPEGKS